MVKGVPVWPSKVVEIVQLSASILDPAEALGEGNCPDDRGGSAMFLVEVRSAAIQRVVERVGVAKNEAAAGYVAAVAEGGAVVVDGVRVGVVAANVEAGVHQVCAANFGGDAVVVAVAVRAAPVDVGVLIVEAVEVRIRACSRRPRSSSR